MTTLITTNEDGFIYFYLNYVKNAFIKFIRVAFSDEATPDKYLYDADINKSQLAIYSDFPQRLVKIPLIVVSVGAGDAGKTYLGDELVKQTTVAEDGIEGYLYGGILTLNVTINIFGGSMRDTEHLTDLMALYVRYLFINKAAEQKLAYTKVDVGEISADDSIPSDRPYFKNTISTKVTMEFTHLIPASLYDKINDIEFDIGTDFNSLT